MERNDPLATFKCSLDGATYGSCEASHQLTGLAAGAQLTFECSLDGGQFQPCASPNDYTDLAASTSPLHARGRSTPSRPTTTIDARPPRPGNDDAATSSSA